MTPEQKKIMKQIKALEKQIAAEVKKNNLKGKKMQITEDGGYQVTITL